MRVQLLAATGVVLIAPFCAALALSVNQIDQLVVFGDSLSDNGNAAFALGGTLPGNYDPHRLTDGTNTTPSTAGPLGLWIDQLAPKLGLPGPQPFVLGGTNFAMATADTGSNSFFFVSDQVAAYRASRGLAGANPNALYTFWAGANDIADAKNPVTAADNIENNIRTLAGDGAKYFLWLNLPPLGDTPAAIAGGRTALGNAASAAFNNEMAANLASLAQTLNVVVVGVDINALFNRIENDFNSGCTVGPLDPYCFANISTPAQGLSVDPNTYLFWDGEHPTTAAHALVAGVAYDDFVAAPDLTSVPEPAAAGLGLIGLCLGILALRKRRQSAVSI